MSQNWKLGAKNYRKYLRKSPCRIKTLMEWNCHRQMAVFPAKLFTSLSTVNLELGYRMQISLLIHSFKIILKLTFLCSQKPQTQGLLLVTNFSYLFGITLLIGAYKNAGKMCNFLTVNLYPCIYIKQSWMCTSNTYLSKSRYVWSMNWYCEIVEILVTYITWSHYTPHWEHIQWNCRKCSGMHFYIRLA